MTWTCATCSTANEAASSNCSVCGATRTAASAQPQVPVVPVVGAPRSEPPTSTPAPPASGRSAHGSGSQFGVIGSTGEHTVATPATGAAPPVSPPPAPVPAPAGGGPAAGGPRTAAIAVVCTILAVAAVAGIVILVAKPFDKETTPSVSPTTVEVPSDRVIDSTTTAEPNVITTTIPPTTAPPTTQDPIAAAGARLAAMKTTDEAVIDGQLEQWVPQLSSKYVGLEADGIRYDEKTILENHERLVNQFPGADVRLLWSGDYSTFKNGNFWVSVALVPYSTPEAANAWCDSNHIDADNCYAKLLSHTAGSTGATKNRK